MRICLPTKREQGLTMVEILVILVVITCMVFFVFWPTPFAQAKARATRIQCVNNLRAIGCTFRIWDDDHGGQFSMSVPGTNEGSMEFVTGLNAFRHFQVMSNELCTPKILLCPAESDRGRKEATNFTAFGNLNISLFVGVNAKETNATMILSGDRNITNGTLMQNGLMRLTTNALAGWTSEMHKRVGNVLLADGSVQQDSITGLRDQIRDTGDATNLMQMPVLGP